MHKMFYDVSLQQEVDISVCRGVQLFHISVSGKIGKA